MRKLQVSVNSEQMAEFRVGHPEILASLRLAHSRLPQAGPTPDTPHGLLASLLSECDRLVSDGNPIFSAETRRKLAGHIGYHRSLIAVHSPTDLTKAAAGFKIERPNGADAIRQCVAELVAHLGAGLGVDLDLVDAPDTSAFDRSNPLFPLLPRSIFSLKTEAPLHLIAPWFMRSLEVPGDVCEIGCFRGTMSIKFAYVLKILGIDKTVYAFDTFEGFKTDDPSGGQIGVGYYKVDDDEFEELSRWSKVIPIQPVKGDAVQTCTIMKQPLSFVWLDLDQGALMRPVFDIIWPRLTARTIIGVDDVARIDDAGRPVTPGVELWVNEMVEAKRLVELKRYPGDFIRFYRANK